MKARDIMTSPVISVSPGTTVGEIAALLFEKRISAVPVVDGGRLVGMVRRRLASVSPAASRRRSAPPVPAAAAGSMSSRTRTRFSRP